MINTEQKQVDTENILVIKSANQWLEDASNTPARKYLFLKLWKETELAILFGDNNTGKSIYDVQIGKEIAESGKTVAYFDFELDEKEFEVRYSIQIENDKEDVFCEQHYQFPAKFFRICINRDFTNYINFKNQLFDAIHELIQKENLEVLIFDNITALMLDDSKDTKAVMELLKDLKILRAQYEVSVLILAHTPKRNLFNPILKTDLAGTKMLSDLSDAIFAIGVSTQGNNVRYVKQLKARGIQEYEGDNVIVYEIAKEDSFLGFTHIGFGNEKNHLQEKPETDKDKIHKRIIAIKEEDRTLSLQKIEDKINEEFGECTTNRMTVKRVLDKFGKL